MGDGLSLVPYECVEGHRYVIHDNDEQARLPVCVGRDVRGCLARPGSCGHIRAGDLDFVERGNLLNLAVDANCTSNR
jgi:hypothetical protein